MKNKLILAFAFLLVGSCMSIYFSFVKIQSLKIENKRKTKNIETLNSTFEMYKFKTSKGDSLNAVKINSLEYTVKEFKQFRGDDALLIENLKLKVKNLKSVTNISTETVTKIKTKIQYKDSTKCLHYKDDFTSVDGCFEGDVIQLIVQTKDSLTTIASRVPKHHFLWWSWGVKAIEMNIVSKNPNTTFTYLKYIELE